MNSGTLFFLHEHLHALLGDGANPGLVDLHGEVGAVQLDGFLAEVAARAFLDHVAGLAPQPAQAVLELAAVAIGPQPGGHLLVGQALQMSVVAAHAFALSPSHQDVAADMRS